jgi:hypothetical protein
MRRENVCFASLATPVLIAALRLFARPASVTTNDQPSPGGVQVKIDDFVFGPQTI